MKRAAFGFRVHTGWAALVAVEDPVDLASAVILDRQRVEMMQAGAPDAPVFVYHAAAKLPLESAKKLVEQTAVVAEKRAHDELATRIGELSKRGYTVVASGLVAGNDAPPLPPLEKLLKAHSLIHLAEGELYRKALVGASERLRLSVTKVPARQLYQLAAKALGESGELIRRRLDEASRRVGKPWTADQKESLLAALLALG